MMVRSGPPTRDGAGVRRERLWLILDVVEKNPGIEETKLVGVVVLRTGLRKSTTTSYINELLEMGLLVEEEGCYFRPHQLEKD